MLPPARWRAAEAVRVADGLGAHHLADDPDAPQGPSQFDTIATQLRPSPTEDSPPIWARLLTLNDFRGLASGRGRPAPPLSLTPPSEAFARRPDREEVIAGAIGEVVMAEILAYAVFFVLMFGCLFYVMDSLED